MFKLEDLVLEQLILELRFENGYLYLVIVEKRGGRLSNDIPVSRKILSMFRRQSLFFQKRKSL